MLTAGYRGEHGTLGVQRFGSRGLCYHVGASIGLLLENGWDGYLRWWRWGWG
jgi:hypothetical protein